MAGVERVAVKICGLTHPDDVASSVAAGADYLGFVFYPPSPRAVTVRAARELAVAVPAGIAKVALTVDADDALFAQILGEVPIDVLQLHGAETPARVAEIRDRFALPVMKAVGISGPQDLAAIDTYGQVSDMLLIDAKPAEDGPLPGGNGVAFDWRLIAGRLWSVPWMLAGGLTPDNVAPAIALTGARGVDVSSGVERAPGRKESGRIKALIAAANGLTLA